MPTHSAVLSLVRKHVVATCLLILGLLWLASPVESQQVINAPHEDANVYGFGDTRTVGEQFAPINGLHRIAIEVNLSANAPGPLILHIRRSYLGDDIRTATVFRPVSGEQQFSFRPIYAKEPLFWILENPNDKDNTAFVFREIDSTGYEGQAYMKGAAIPGDFAFTQQGSLPYLVSYARSLKQTVSAGIPVFEAYALVFGLAVALGVFVLLSQGKRIAVTKTTIVWIIGVTIVAGIALHMRSTKYLPLNNDEGAYLQDAYQVQHGFIPVRDFLTKGPVYVYVLATWRSLVGLHLPALRALSALSWSVAGGLVYVLAKRMTAPTEVAVAAAVLLIVSPAAIFLTTPLLLQTVSVPIGLAALYVCLRGAQDKKTELVTLSAVLMVVVYMTRASSIVYAVLGLIIILYFSPRKWRDTARYVVAGLATAAFLALLLYVTMGLEKTAIILNLEALLISQQRGSVQAAAAEPFIRQLVIGARTLWRSAPWLIGGLLLAPLTVAPRRLRQYAIVLASVMILLLMAIWHHIADVGWFIPSSDTLSWVVTVLLVFGVPAASYIFLPSQKPHNTPNAQFLVLWSAAWLVGMLVLYGQWGDFTDNYVIEFLPPLSLITAISGVYIWKQMGGRRLVQAALAGILAAGCVTGWYIARANPHTGSMDQAAVIQAAKRLDDLTAPGEEIFTAQSAITAFANRPIVKNYSHSGWYLYEKRGTVSTQLRQTLFVEPEVITDYLKHEAKTIVTDRRTRQVYFDDYPERQALLENEFTLDTEIKNPESEPFRIYVRKN